MMMMMVVVVAVFGSKVAADAVLISSYGGGTSVLCVCGCRLVMKDVGRSITEVSDTCWQPVALTQCTLFPWFVTAAVAS